MRVLCTVAAFSLLLVGAPIAGIAQAQNADALMAKHAAYTGFASNAQQATWFASGTRTDRRVSDRFSEVRRGLLYRDTVSTTQGLDDTVGFSGSTVWHADENGFTAAIHGRLAKAAIDFDIVRSEALSALGTTAVVGSANVRGIASTIVRATPSGGTPMDLYVDPQTGAYVRVVVDPGGASTTFDNLQYGAAGDAQKAIDAWAVDGDIYTLSEIDTGHSITDAALAPPTPTATWTFAAGETVPLVYATNADNDRQVKVRASVNGHAGIFLLSTSTPSILLYEPFAVAAGIKDIGTSDFSPYLGNVQYNGYGRAATLQVGSSVLHDVIVERMSSANPAIAGVLGYDFYAGAIVGVDLRQRSLQLLDPSIYTAEVAGGGYGFQLDLTNRTPTIAMRLPTGATAFPVLDTGLNGLVILSQALNDKRQIGGVPIEDFGMVEFQQGWGATSDPIVTTSTTINYEALNSAGTSGVCVAVKRLQIGPYTYLNPETCFGGTNVFGQDRGLVGMDFLRHFNWTIDYPDAIFAVDPNGE
ncbi:MAG TPA: hypothetical protein VIJ12_09940 [Candidatus Baltobacteraceae bacterium]